MITGPLIEPAEQLCEQVIGAAITVHRALGPGLLESIYEKALAFELRQCGLHQETQVAIPLLYQGHNLGLAFRADMIVENTLLLELKSVSELNALHLSQVLSYLRLLGFKRGFLFNFNVRRMVDGIQRVSI